MSPERSARREPIARVVSPNEADAQLALAFLGENGIEGHACASLLEAAQALDESTGCLVIVEEALLADELPALHERLARLPAWADLPLVLIARDATAFAVLAAESFPESGNVTLLGRPLSPLTLISAVQMARGGVRVGPPLDEFQGVLTGVPSYLGGQRGGALR